MGDGVSNKEAIAALALAQSQMKTPHKDATNPHFRNRYASLKSCIKAIKPALNDNGFALIQAAGKDEQGHYIQTTFEHTSGGLFTSKFYMEPEKKGMQGLGSAATYAKRYGLLGLAGIEPDEDADDDGNAADEPPAAPKPKPQPKKPDPEAEHDAAVREEQNTAPSTPQQLKKMMEDKIKAATETWQLKKILEEHGKDFMVIKKDNPKNSSELNAYWKLRLEQLNTGER
tara:strand:+ start:174 stop:860 length:687 start_codon:yes stop_codon:yes gene_type:complete